MKSNNYSHNQKIAENQVFFSIVMACYNVEDYVKEAIDSVINQSFDFNGHVEIILVDDGSFDGTAKICKQYVDEYPQNIRYFFKENGGQASARNFGINYASGKYINFLDADDKLMKNTLNNVFDFFEENNSKIDLVAVPMYFFERQTGDHPLNYKFEETRVIDLDMCWCYPQLATNSAFFKREVFDKFQFDTNLISSEDAIMVNKLLLEKNAYGVVKDGGLCYRKRFDETSTIDTSKLNKRFYIGRLDGFFKELIYYSITNVGYVPKFIQYVIIYDIKWMLMAEERFEILTDDELVYFDDGINYVLNNVNDEIIDCHLKKDPWEIKKYIYELKYGKSNIVLKDDDIVIGVNNTILDKLSYHFIYLDIIEIKNNHLFISGFLKSYFKRTDVDIILFFRGSKHEDHYLSKTFNYFNRKESVIFKSWINFDFDVPLKANEEYEFTIQVKPKKFDSTFELPIRFSNYARLSEVSNYSVWDNFIIHFKNNKFFINNYSYFKMFKWEIRIFLVLLKHRPYSWTSTAFIRFIYLILFPFYKNKTIWMFMDRRDSADDNAEHLYKYCSDINDGVDKYFTLSNDSKDFNRLCSSLKNILPFYSIKQRIMYLFSEKIISSHPDEFILNPFWGKNSKLYSGLINSKKIFLQHGVTKDNVSSWLRKYDKNLDMLVTVSEMEAQSFSDYEYNYDEKIIRVLGFPRFDNLNNLSDRKQILIMPTWRRSIDNLKDEQIVKSLYFQKMNSLFNNKRLIKLAKEHGYTIIIKPHPKIMDIMNLFDENDYVHIDKTSSYQDLFNNSSLLITDYSSVSFDFAYNKKPVIYYQYADDYHFQETFFDYKTMGFGEVISEEDELINVINQYLVNNCEMDSEYKKRVDKFFKFKDKNNCKRIYNAIKEL